MTKYERRGLATILGAPISWVALFGALIGFSSLIPMIFYIFGGGFLSVGMVIFGPIAGMVLGPFAGYVAGVIGGLIGMFISPASYPLGFIDANLSGAFIPLFWGLMNKKYAKLTIPFWIMWMLVAIVWPYHYPGPAGGFASPNEPTYTISWLWTYLGFALFLALGLKFVPNWIKEGSPRRNMIAGLLLYNFMANTAWMVPWKIIYFGILKYPSDVVVADNLISWWAYTLPMVIASTAVGLVVLEALRKSGLRRPPGGIV